MGLDVDPRCFNIEYQSPNFSYRKEPSPSGEGFFMSDLTEGSRGCPVNTGRSPSRRCRTRSPGCPTGAPSTNDSRSCPRTSARTRRSRKSCQSNANSSTMAGSAAGDRGPAGPRSRVRAAPAPTPPVDRPHSVGGHDLLSLCGSPWVGTQESQRDIGRPSPVGSMWDTGSRGGGAGRLPCAEQGDQTLSGGRSHSARAAIHWRAKLLVVDSLALKHRLD